MFFLWDMFFFKCFSENYRNIHESVFFFLKIASSSLHINICGWYISVNIPSRHFGMRSSVGYQWMKQLFFKRHGNALEARSVKRPLWAFSLTPQRLFISFVQIELPPSTIKRTTSNACNQLSFDKLHKNQRKWPGSINTMLRKPINGQLDSFGGFS